VVELCCEVTIGYHPRFGAGFFAQTMEEQPYTIVVDGAGAASERRMANHAAGRALAPTLKVLSNTVAAGRRTVVLSRPAAVRRHPMPHTALKCQAPEIINSDTRPRPTTGPRPGPRELHHGPGRMGRLSALSVLL
jgi:hypothetical protein